MFRKTIIPICFRMLILLLLFFDANPVFSQNSLAERFKQPESITNGTQENYFGAENSLQIVYSDTISNDGYLRCLKLPLSESSPKEFSDISLILSPEKIKPQLDKYLAEGANRLEFHLPVQPTEALWKSIKILTEYASRCQVMLQYGRSPADIAVFDDKDSLQQFLLNRMKDYSYHLIGKDELFQFKTDGEGNIQLNDSTNYQVVIFANEYNYSSDILLKMVELRNEGADILYADDIISEKTTLKVAPEIVAPEYILSIHQTSDLGDIYFISNQKGTTMQTDISFRGNKYTPTFWNPVNGEITKAENYRREGNNTMINMALAPYESVFVVFSFKSYADNRKAFVLDDPIAVDGKWTVRSKNKNSSDDLTNLTETTVYTTTFNCKYDIQKLIDQYTRPVYLSLSQIPYPVTIKVNGIECGIVWTAPYEAEIIRALKKGSNTIELEVTNPISQQSFQSELKTETDEFEQTSSGFPGRVKIFQK